MRAVIDDFFSDKYAERARQEHAYTSGMSHLGRPLGMWCRLHYNPKETGGCIESFHVKWAKELGTPLKSEAFVRDMVAREIKTSAACSEAIRALQDSRDILPDPAEVSACQGQLWEWARMRNEVEAFCIQSGASRKNWDGRIQMDYRSCVRAIDRRSLEQSKPTTTKPRRRP